MSRGCLALATLAAAGASIAPADDAPEAWLDQARAAAKEGDAAKSKELSVRVLDARPDSVADRFAVAQIAELRKEPAIAREHYAEIVFAVEQAAKRKEKVSDEAAKLAKDAAAKVKSLPDPHTRDLARALKEFTGSALKTARLAKSKQHWLFAADIGKTLKHLHAGLPGILDPRDAAMREAEKIVNEGLVKRTEDKPDVATSLKADLSVATGALGKTLNEIAERAAAVHAEVRGPHTRRRALAPLGILIGLKNDPDGHAKKAEAVWKKAYEVEPTSEAVLRIATDGRSWYVRLNGAKVAESPGRVDTQNYREVPVRVFRDANVLAVFGHEAVERKTKVPDQYRGRVWTLVDLMVSEKEHVVSETTWGSAMAPPNGWDMAPDAVIDFFPTTLLETMGTPWDYEKTKSWKGDTIVGDITDTFLRKVFDLPSSGAPRSLRGDAGPAPEPPSRRKERKAPADDAPPGEAPASAPAKA